MIDRIEKERIDAFLAELTELSHKYSIRIGGCGCCGSPYLVHDGDLQKEKYVVDERQEELKLTSDH